MEGRNYNHDLPMSLLFLGCDLAKKMESYLHSLGATSADVAGDPTVLSQKCDEIIKSFSMAKQQLTSAGLHSLPSNHHHPYQPDIGFAHQQANSKGKGKGKEVAGDIVEVSMKADSGGQDGMMEVGGSLSSASLMRNPRRSSRNNDDEGSNRRVMVAAPKVGNTEMPPEDGFTWRKYGQKEILNAKYPRSYYRCTHQKLYNCPAKKQVQRLDDDPSIFDILYRGEHICHMSNTAPSVPPPSQAVKDMFLPHQPIATVASQFPQWFPVNPTIPSSEDARIVFYHQQDEEQLYRASGSRNILCTNNAEGEPSTVRSHQGKDQAVDILNNQPMIDWTEMFNSGSSSSNSMEVIFTPADDTKDIKD